jgi:hypothetical protein
MLTVSFKQESGWVDTEPISGSDNPEMAGQLLFNYLSQGWGNEAKVMEWWFTNRETPFSLNPNDPSAPVFHWFTTTT